VISRPEPDDAIAMISTMRSDLSRIAIKPEVMGGKPCIRGVRVTVSTVVGLVATGHSHEEILALYPYLQAEDIGQALAYMAGGAGEPVTTRGPR